MSNISKSIVMASAVATAIAGIATQTAAEGNEKCFGISLAGENDCAAHQPTLSPLSLSTNFR